MCLNHSVEMQAEGDIRNYVPRTGHSGGTWPNLGSRKISVVATWKKDGVEQVSWVEQDIKERCLSNPEKKPR